MLKTILEKYFRWRFRKKGGLVLEWQRDEDFTLGGISNLFKGAYTPKYVRTNNASKLLEVKNQEQLNTCVCESGTAGKETDEGVLLDLKWMAAYLRSRGQMSDKGTSLSYYQDALRKVGIPLKKKEFNRSAGWNTFSDPQQLTQQSLDEASRYKTESYFRTYDLDKVLEELDNGRVGHTGGKWYSGYNSSGLSNLGLVIPYSGYYVGGHATLIVDYDQDYYGNKVLKVLNSYSSSYGKNGFFYVKFEDLNKVFEAGVYFNSDLPKDTVGWLSLNAGAIIKEQNGPKVYLIENDKKRHIPDEAILMMVLVAHNKPTFKEDTDNMLPQVAEGEPVAFEEIPEWAKETAKQMAKWSQYPDWTKVTFQKYFPDLGN